VETRLWDFGDGTTSTEANPGHTYTSEGSFTASLIVTGPGGADSTVQIISVSSAPQPLEAGFSASTTSGSVPLTVSFTDLSTGGVLARTWLFGDGSSSNAANPVHTYLSQGSYAAILAVAGAGGVTSTALTFIDVGAAPPPIAALSATPTSGGAPLTVAFSDLSSGSVESRSWDFGDGGTSNGENPSHRYDAPGSYDAALTVEGPGGSDSASVLITVPEAAENLLLTCGLLLLFLLRQGVMRCEQAPGMAKKTLRGSG